MTRDEREAQEVSRVHRLVRRELLGLTVAQRRAIYETLPEELFGVRYAADVQDAHKAATVDQARRTGAI